MSEKEQETVSDTVAVRSRQWRSADAKLDRRQLRYAARLARWLSERPLVANPLQIVTGWRNYVRRTPDSAPR